MHPLDTFSFEGFVMPASGQVVVRRPFSVVWRALGPGGEEPYELPDGLTHRVIERFEPGEHRCSTFGTREGREYCAKGFRRLLAGCEVLEVQCLPALDQLVRITCSPLRRGRTVIATDVGYRVKNRTREPAGSPLLPGCTWQEFLTRTHEQALRRLLDSGVRAQ